MLSVLQNQNVQQYELRYLLFLFLPLTEWSQRNHNIFEVDYENGLRSLLIRFCSIFILFRWDDTRASQNKKMNNSTTEQNFAQESMGTVYTLLPIALIIVLTNGLVFVLFYKSKVLRTPSNVFLLGLAICDFSTGAVNIPYFLVFSLSVVPRSSPMFTDFVHWMFVIHMLVAISAAYHILAITADKYLAIIQPLKHYLMSKKTVLKVLVAIWVVSGFIATIQFAWRGKSPLYDVVHTATCLILAFFFPYAFMIYAYTVMFKAVIDRKKSKGVCRNIRRLKDKNRKDRKCILIFSIMALIYLCCWLPYFTIVLIYSVKIFTKANDFSGVDKAAEPIAITRYITSAINPLLYTFFKRDFWRALRGFFGSKRKSGSTLRNFSLTYVSVIRRSKLIRNDSRCIEDSTRTSHLLESAEIPCTEFESDEKRFLHVSSV